MTGSLGDAPRVPSTNISMSSDSDTDSVSKSSSLASGLNKQAANMDVLLKRIPSSPKALLSKLERQSDQNRILQHENLHLKAKEVELSSIAVQLQNYFVATQNQVDRLKHEVHVELANPVSEEEYQRIESIPSEKRDLLETIKLGIYRQLGSLRSSYKGATQRAAELSAEVGKLTEENNELKVVKKELDIVQQNQREDSRAKDREIEKSKARIAELEGDNKSMESKLKAFYHDQEQFLSAKLTAQVKTDEVARMAVRLEEVNMDLATAKTSAECSEQKLDILKSEYYEMKLKYSQRIQELESALKASDEKLKSFGELEMESELFIANLSEHVDSTGRFVDTQDKPSIATQLESYAAIPRSRKLAHTLLVTKRCLHLENKVQLLTREGEFKDQQISKLQASLNGARQALNNINSPYLLLEKTLDQLCEEKDALQKRVTFLESESTILRNRLKQRNEDIKVLCKHRSELLQMKKLLHFCKGGVDAPITTVPTPLATEQQLPPPPRAPTENTTAKTVSSLPSVPAPDKCLSVRNSAGIFMADPIEILS